MSFFNYTMTMNIKMKRIKQKAALLLLATMISLGSVAQQRTSKLTLYPEYKPATITLADGRVIKNPFTNVFLKNSSLLYLHGTSTMEANMSTISRVDFDDRFFVNIDNQLASVVDTIGTNVLYRIDYLDVDAYTANLKNNIQISHLTITDFVNTDIVDQNSEDDYYTIPLIHKYYMLYNGKLVYVHEREIWQRLTKEKKRLFRTIVGLPDFTWVDDASIIKLLKAISD